MYDGMVIIIVAEEEGEDDDEPGGDNLPQSNKPETVISLDASDEFLKERVMNLPQVEVEGTHNTEEGKPFKLVLV